VEGIPAIGWPAEWIIDEGRAMRRIVIVGAGQAGLLLALGLQRKGYDVTVLAEREAGEVRAGRLISNQAVFRPALSRERELGINFWDGKARNLEEVFFAAAGETGPEPAIAWRAKLDRPAQSVDQRVKVSAWMTEFVRRGGELRIQRVNPEDLEEYAREFELVLVAAGRGPQFAGLFKRNEEFSPYPEAQRSLGVMYVHPAGEAQLPVVRGLNYGMGRQGEFFALPVWSVNGPVYGCGFWAIPGSPMDVWDSVTSTEQHIEVSRMLLRQHFPWLAGFLEAAVPSSELDTLRGRVHPVVRQPVGTLPSGAKVLAMGDTAVTNDPIAGQGANMASYAARSYEEAIVAQEDRPFDEEFMRGAFARFWERARHSTRFSNDLLAPPPDHVLDTLEAAQTLPEVAHRFAHLFENPEDYSAWLADPAKSYAYLEEVRARTENLS
jgi:flavin-dependent dehydrogenase